MPDVRIAERRIWVDNEARALLSGEVHFWRLDPGVWPAVLARARDIGLRVLSTYVCWAFHEVGPREYDFVGATNPRRDLLGFIDLVEREGFWLLLRPGPYIYAEWPNSGVPDRVVQWHRLHPSFQAEAADWMRAVVEVAGPRLATRGGPIVLWQADNEADAWTDVYGGQLDLQTSVVVPVPGYEREYVEYCRLRHTYATELVHWTANQYRRLGVDVPVYANTYIDCTVQNWRDIEHACDLAGPDIYPTSEFGRREHRQVLEAVRYARTYSVLPFIPEFEAGIWHGWHRQVGPLSDTHYSLTGFSAMQAGAAGWNWYMLVNRDNWYMSPINETGNVRPDLEPGFKGVVDAYRRIDPPSLEKLGDTAVTFDVLERAARLPESFAAELLLEALYATDIDYEFFDVETGRTAKPLLLYASGRWLADHAQRQLLSYVESGGTLVFFQTLPVLDDSFQALNVLNLKAPEAITSSADPHRLRVDLGQQAVELSSAAVFAYAEVPGEPIHAERVRPRPPGQEGGYAHVLLPVGQRITVGYVQSRGAGRIIVLGLAPTSELLITLHAWLGVRIPCRSSVADVHSALFRRQDELLAILTNTAHEDREATLHIDLTGRAASERLNVRVPARSGTFVSLGAAGTP